MNMQNPTFQPACSTIFKSWILVGILSSLFSCGSKKPDEIFVQTPILLPEKNYLNPVCNEVFFTEAHFNYANNLKKDSTKIFYTSETIIAADTAKYFLRNCQATQHGDSLMLFFSDDPFSRSFYELKILKVGERVVADYYQTFSITDSSYKIPTFKPVYQNVLLDKKAYKTGGSLKGKIDMKISATHLWPENYKDTIAIYGLIKTIVE